MAGNVLRGRSLRAVHRHADRRCRRCGAAATSPSPMARSVLETRADVWRRYRHVAFWPMCAPSSTTHFSVASYRSHGHTPQCACWQACSFVQRFHQPV